MSEVKDPYHMTGEELQQEADRQDKKNSGVLAELVEAAVDIVAEILDGIS